MDETKARIDLLVIQPAFTCKSCFFLCQLVFIQHNVNQKKVNLSLTFIRRLGY